MTLSFGLVLTERAHAQDERARLHFQAGASYYEAGDYEDALREFQRSHALSQRSELFYNFSLCYQQLGDLENAALYLRRFLDEVQGIENRDQLERRHENLVERIAQRGSGTSTPDAGSSDPERDDEADEAERDDEAAVSGEASDSSRGGVPIGAVIGYAAAGVGLVLAATFGPLALKERGRIEDGCGATRSCAPGDVAQMDGFALAADIGLVMTVAGATVGTILLLTGRGGDDEAADPEQARVRFAPYASPMGAGGVLRGSF